MSLTPGTRLGVYEITSLIGEGGMGQVFQATDTKLKRQVAIKILPPSVAADHDRLARFQREAEVLASLNHPHIAAIYGLEDSGGLTALVMELVAGDDLSQRIARGAIPLDEALPMARQIAEALEAAHEQGIIHRDLKPANIKVRADGTVKVLDFGLAKAGVGAELAPPGGVSMSPTITTPAMTQAGMILGTAAYMSPEQAKGRSVDKRSDIWAFGAVLYEMLTGERCFKGEDVSETLASILKDTPSLGTLPASTPPRLRRLIERCLDRDAKQRLRDIGEARVEIAKIETGAPDSSIVSAATVEVAPRRSRGEFIAWTVAAVAVIAAIAIGWLRPASIPADLPHLVRLPFVPPGNVAAADVGSAVVSPDGQKLVFSARSSSDGRRMLWVRPLDSLDAQPLPDTEDALEPFWSPDSRSIGFGAQGKLKRVDIAGGRAQTLADAARINGGAWSPSGVIVYSPDFRLPLYRVAAGGGERVRVTGSNQEGRYPSFLPDGRHFLYYVASSGTPSTWIGSIDAMEGKQLLPDAAPAVFARPGWVLYNRNGLLVARPFAADQLAFAGEPLPVATGPTVANIAVGGRFSVSDNGVLVTQDVPMVDYQLRWFDRSGRNIGTLGPVLTVAAGQVPRLSPDGTRVVIQRFDPERRQELWIGDVTRGTFERLTTFFAQSALWSPDSRTVICATIRNNIGGMYAIPAAGGDAQLLVKGTVFPTDESRDGKWLFYVQRGERTRSDIWALPLSARAPQTSSGEPHLVLNSEFEEREPQASPDGRWLAYTADTTGSYEVYVRPLTVDGTVGPPARVSTSGGAQPRWGHDGRELFYVSTPRNSPAAELIAVTVKTGTVFEVGAAVTLFKVPMIPNGPLSRDYDVSLDGQRFLVGTVVKGMGATPVTIVLNWPAGLKK